MMIYLGYASASFLESPPLLQGALWHVPEWRREKALRYRDMRALRRSLAAALLLEWIFLNCFQGEKREFSFQNGPDGRPLLTGRPRLFCSISHGETYVCAAVGTVPVGVDIEQRNACSMEIAKEFFSPEELEAEEKGMCDFTELWALKESCLKLHGKGMAAANKTAVLFFKDRITVFDEPDIRFYQFHTPEGAGALCWKSDGPSVEIREIGAAGLESLFLD